MPMLNASLFPSPIHLTRCALILLLLVHGSARAESGLPEGTWGWTYFSSKPFPQYYASDPVTACEKSAFNHMRQPLVEARPYKDRRDMFECYYPPVSG
ncbi:hypothetical protein F2P44_17565 [Massilia sp. CCM 8695]|uniref:Secreted protein n=1 Tax=Massilia frigida TaxID=2609281 RepID=A0ABX0NG27_9BURK|nr:hypothetical protein [Massilia frigida]